MSGERQNDDIHENYFRNIFSLHSDYMKKNFCDFFRNTTVQDAHGAAENTRCHNNERQPCLTGNYRQFFVSWFSEVNGIRTEGRQGVEAP